MVAVEPQVVQEELLEEDRHVVLMVEHQNPELLQMKVEEEAYEELVDVVEHQNVEHQIVWHLMDEGDP